MCNVSGVPLGLNCTTGIKSLNSTKFSIFNVLFPSTVYYYWLNYEIKNGLFSFPVQYSLLLLSARQPEALIRPVKHPWIAFPYQNRLTWMPSKDITGFELLKQFELNLRNPNK